MDKMYREYIKERLGQQITETDKGFLNWHIDTWNGESVISMNDIFVLPEHRDSKAALELYELAIQQGKVNNCKYIIAYVEANLPEARKRLIAYLVRLRFDILEASMNKIVLYREI